MNYCATQYVSLKSVLIRLRMKKRRRQNNILINYLPWWNGVLIQIDLAEGVYNTVSTRFPPEPNGYLHIGHAKSILLNSGLAGKYNGTFNLRFDDTNPTKEKVEFVESIKADVEWLGADYEDRLYFASDYFQTMYECAVLLIKKGEAYVCDRSFLHETMQRCILQFTTNS